jgi:tRNA modification GTPase
MNPLDDTIIAISTPPGRGGLGVIRLSGADALAIAGKIFRPKHKAKDGIPARSLQLGEIYDRHTGAGLDEAFLTYFPSPHSYTREDVVELSCHGSPVILEEAVRLGVCAGARLAQPGEFTLRAYLHGRVDILQAEAVNDLISAVALPQARVSARQVQGGLSRRVADFRRRIVEVTSLIEASIEFPDEDLGVSRDRIEAGLEETIKAVDALAGTHELGREMVEGTVLAIAGRANVGKSTLFNALLDEERAIVSPHRGTTRDYLRERLKIGEAVFQLIDMAGLEKPAHPLEKEGVRRGAEMASRADGILLVLDASRPETRADLELLRRFRDKKTILLFNKSDLAGKIDAARCRKEAGGGVAWLEISALKRLNLDALRELIRGTFVEDRSAAEEEVVLHQRQKLLLQQIAGALTGGLDLLRRGHSEELCVEEIRRALPLVGQLTGEITADEVVDEIFGRFCVGK